METLIKNPGRYRAALSHNTGAGWGIPCNILTKNIVSAHLQMDFSSLPKLWDWSQPRWWPPFCCCQGWKSCFYAASKAPPKFALLSVTSQPALTAVNDSVPVELVHSRLYKQSCLALGIWMHLIYAQPWPFSSVFPPATWGHPPHCDSFSPAFPLCLNSHVNKGDMAWQRCCPASSHPLRVQQMAVPFPQHIFPGVFIWGLRSWSQAGVMCLDSHCFALGTRGCLGPSRRLCNLWTPRCHSLGAACKPKGCGSVENKIAISGGKKNPFAFLCELSGFLTQQRVLLFPLQQAVLQVCIAVLHRSPQGHMTPTGAAGSLLPLRPPSFSPERTGSGSGRTPGCGRWRFWAVEGLLLGAA